MPNTELVELVEVVKVVKVMEVMEVIEPVTTVESESEPEVEPEVVETITPKKRKKKHFLNNGDLLEETIKSQTNGRMTDKLGKMLMILCDRYRASRTGNFTRYTYFDEMKSAALENLVKNAWHKFNAELYTNAFAYYTSCVHNSYLQVLKYEKKHRNIRDSLLIESGQEASFTYMEENSSNNDSDTSSDGVEDNYKNNASDDLVNY